jgi:hypothetical protein
MQREAGCKVLHTSLTYYARAQSLLLWLVTRFRFNVDVSALDNSQYASNYPTPRS